MTQRHKVIVIAGPTASGKSALALSLAREKNGIIINADSLQLYDALPLLTAQPSESEKNQAPHRLYAVLKPGEICSAGRWRELALGEIEAALSQGQLPLIVGGTGFYIKALMEGLSPVPAVPADIRAAVMEKHAEMGAAAFHEWLATVDPEAAARLNPNDTQRVIRALEVYEATGTPLSHWQQLPPVPPPAHLEFEVRLVLPPREELFTRCDNRFLKMMEQGALEEVRSYEGPDSKALGYAELRAHLAGEMKLEDAIALAQQKTRNYAKRQTTWFKNQMESATAKQ